MTKRSTKRNRPEKGFVPYECSECKGAGKVQSADGSKTVDCTKCDGSGKYKPF